MGGGGKIWTENSITFNVFFIETFPKVIKYNLNQNFEVHNLSEFEFVNKQ